MPPASLLSSGQKQQHPLTCEDIPAALHSMHAPTQGESLTKIPLANVSSRGSSKDKLGILDNVLEEWE